MKIVYLYYSMATWGGTERILVDKMNYFARQYGYDVYLITSDQGGHPVLYGLDERVHFIDLNIRFHSRYKYNVIRRQWEFFRLSRLYHKKLEEQLRFLQPDLLVCTTIQTIKSLIKIKKDIPLVVESHINFLHPESLIHKIKKLINNYWIGKAEALVTLTEGDAKVWRHVSNHVHVIPNIVNLNNTGGYSDNLSKRVLFVGRFAEQKGIGDLFDIWKLIHESCPDWYLDLYGDGELWDKFKNEANSLNINIEVHQPTAQIFDVYRNSSIFVLTSVYEPFGLVMPEAMSCGLPVVAFDCPYGPSLIIEDGKDGFLIKNRDIHAFADKVCQLIEDAPLRKAMGQRAIVSSQRFSVDKIMPMWKQLFEELVSLP